MQNLMATSKNFITSKSQVMSNESSGGQHRDPRQENSFVTLDFEVGNFFQNNDSIQPKKLSVISNRCLYPVIKPHFMGTLETIGHSRRWNVSQKHNWNWEAKNALVSPIYVSSIWMRNLRQLEGGNRQGALVRHTGKASHYVRLRDCAALFNKNNKQQNGMYEY